VDEINPNWLSEITCMYLNIRHKFNDKWYGKTTVKISTVTYGDIVKAHICFMVNIILNLQQPASGHFRHNIAMLF